MSEDLEIDDDEIEEELEYGDDVDVDDTTL